MSLLNKNWSEYFDENGFCKESRFFIVYQTDKNNIYRNKEKEYISKGCTPSNLSYIDEPPETKPFYQIKRNIENNSWEYIEDFTTRDVYSKEDGSLINIVNYGPLPNNATLLPRPTQYHIWQNDNWEEDQELKQKYIQKIINDYIIEIDNKASFIISKWTRFMPEYSEREKAAIAFRDANFEGEASEYISSFASVVGIDNKTATIIILGQAVKLRSGLKSIASLRMQKFKLNADNLDLIDLKNIKDDIINKMEYAYQQAKD